MIAEVRDRLTGLRERIQSHLDLDLEVARDVLLVLLDEVLRATPAGLWCADGGRGEFKPGRDPCQRCGAPGWKHWTQPRRGGR